MNLCTFFCLLFFVSLSSSNAPTCPSTHAPDPFKRASDLLSLDTGLDGLFILAKNFRAQFFGNILNHRDVRTSISQIYNGTTPFSTLAFLYQSFWSDVLYIAVFVLVLAIALPVLLIILWLYWAYCIISPDEISNYECESEEQPKYTSKVAQAVTCCLGLIIIISQMVLAVFIIILYIGAERTNNSVSTSSALVNQTLPMIVRLHDEVLRNVDKALITDTVDLNNSVYENCINPLRGDITSAINVSLYSNITGTLYNISSKTSQLELALSLSSDILRLQQSLNTFFNSYMWNNLVHNLTTISEICTNITTTVDPTSSLWSYCHFLVANISFYIPSVSPTVLNITQLQILVHSLENIIKVATPPLITNRISNFNEFLNITGTDVDQLVINLTHSYLDPIINNLMYIGNHINRQYRPIDYGLPDSQRAVEDYLGDGNLSNWNEFQYYTTIAFSLALFVLIIGVALAVGRGLLNVCSIYLYGADRSYIKSMHHAAITLKKLTIWMFLSGLISSFFFIFILAIASLVGRTCGNYGNYTEFIQEVIDNNSTWNGVYPLGSVYHNSSVYPLKLNSILMSCSANSSTVDALKLQIPFQLDKISSNDMSVTHEQYIAAMGLVPDSVSVYSILGMSLESALYEYCRLDWSYNQLLVSPFDGVSTLQSLVTNLNVSLVNVSNISSTFDQLLQHTDSILPHLSNISDWLNRSWQQFQNSSSLLSTILQESDTLLSQLRDIKSKELNVQSIIYRTIDTITVGAASNITSKVEKFSSEAEYTISCTIGTCYPVSELYSQFSVSVCDNVLSGLDTYWISLFVFFSVSVLSLLLMLLLAGFFFDKKNLQSYRGMYFSLTDRILSQSAGVLWLILTFSVDILLLTAIATDDVLATKCTSCCISCLWGSGIVFLVFSGPLCISLRVYEWVLLHRVRVYRGPRVQQLQRLWLTRIAATSFYSQLSLFFILYVPFIGISGSYVTSKGVLSVTAFFSLVVSLIGMCSFFLVLVIERKQLMEYMNLLQQEAKNYCCFWKNKFVPTAPGSDSIGGMPNGCGQEPAVQQDEISGETFIQRESPPVVLRPAHVLPETILEEEETSMVDEENVDGAQGQLEISPPEIMPPALDDYLEPYEEDVIEDTDVNKLPSVLFDRDIPEDHGFVRMARAVTGIDIARSDTISTPRSSIYNSYDSVSGSYYHSSSHIPGYTSTDDSSYKDGYDSNDSEYSSYIGQIKVEV